MMIYRGKKQPQLPVTRCVYCGSYDLGIGWQQNEAIVTFRRNGFLGNRLKYVICRNCGAVLYQCVACLLYTSHCQKTLFPIGPAVLGSQTEG